MEKPNELKISQWNARSLKIKWSETIKYLTTNQIHIAAVQGTWIDKNDSLYDNQYKIVQLPREAAYGGEAFILHKSINYNNIIIMYIVHLMITMFNCYVFKIPISKSQSIYIIYIVVIEK